MEKVIDIDYLSIKKVKEFIHRNKNAIMIGIFILLIIFGRSLYVLNARIDTEIVINTPNSVYNWLAIGRQGAIFTRILFENLNFNPYLATILSFIIYIISMIAIGYLFEFLGDINYYISLSLFLLFLVHPIWVEQFYFSLQVLEASLAVLLSIVACFFSYYGIIYNKKIVRFLSIPLMIWAFSTYQLFAILYVSITIFSFILLFRRLSFEGTDINSKQYIQLIIKLIILFLIAMIINTIITKAFFFSGGSYLEESRRWGKDFVFECIKNIFNHINNVITGEGIFYSYGYIISVILMMSALVCDILKMKNIKLKWMYALSIIMMQICPFLMTIYGGVTPAYRAQFVLPFIIACNLCFSIICYKSVKVVNIIYVLAVVMIFISQLQIVMRMQYTDDIRYQEDIRLGSQIEERIASVTNGQTKPIAFVGVKDAQLNSVCVRGELIGKSIFNHDSEIEPHYYNSSNRIVDLLKTMGFKMNNVSHEQMLEARGIAKNMQSWPSNNSVYDAGEFVIVKLSEDEWYGEDILEGKATKTEISKLNFNNELFRWAVDEVSIKNEEIIVKGWLIKPDVSSENALINLYILNENDGGIYKLETTHKLRPDLNNAFKNESDYTNSGYIAKAPISQLNLDTSKYRIILSYVDEEDEKFIDTIKYIE